MYITAIPQIVINNLYSDCNSIMNRFLPTMCFLSGCLMISHMSSLLTIFSLNGMMKSSMESVDVTLAIITKNVTSEVQSIDLSFPTEPLPPFGRCPGGVAERPIVQYLRDKNTMAQQKNSTTCTNSLDVLAWLMDKVNAQNETMLMAYGGLIHVLRERDFVHPNGKYIDDDFDTWLTMSSFEYLVGLESEMWDQFGWTLRIFQNCKNHAVFGQMFSACGHKYTTAVSKSKQDHPGIELYVLQPPVDNSGISIDIWQGPALPEKLLYPQRYVSLQSTGTNATLNLQIPSGTEEILTCFYGNWSIPAKKHARGGRQEQCLQTAAETFDRSI